jgi:hypothetical protein
MTYQHQCGSFTACMTSKTARSDFGGGGEGCASVLLPLPPTVHDMHCMCRAYLPPSEAAPTTYFWCCAALPCCVVLCCAVQELGRSPFPVVRNNIMVALSDMLIQYTALVDAHMPRLAGCIRWVETQSWLPLHGPSKQMAHT